MSLCYEALVKNEDDPVFDEKMNELLAEVKDLRTLFLQKDPKATSRQFEEKADGLIHELQDSKKFLDSKLLMLDKMNLLMTSLTYKTYESQYQFRKNLDALTKEKDKVLLTVEEGKVPLELLNLEAFIREYHNKFHEKITNYKKTHNDLQNDYDVTVAYMDEVLHCMQDNVYILISDKEEHFPSSSDTTLLGTKVTEAIDEYSETIENFQERKLKGWKTEDSQDDLLNKLNKKGLVVTKSGMMLTRSGEKITVEEAEQRNLLDSAEVRKSIVRPTEVKNEDLLSKSRDTIMTESLEDNCSKMSTEDVCYLKQVLGKPLTLALAEITEKQPRDPIHYLGHWLFKYRYNEQFDQIQKKEYDDLMEERKKIIHDKLHKIYTDEANVMMMEMLANVDDEVSRRELKRILEQEAIAEEEAEEDEKRRLEKLALELEEEERRQLMEGQGFGETAPDDDSFLPIQLDDTVDIADM